jgi:hypothetical protein
LSTAGASAASSPCQAWRNQNDRELPTDSANEPKIDLAPQNGAKAESRCRV